MFQLLNLHSFERNQREAPLLGVPGEIRNCIFGLLMTVGVVYVDASRDPKVSYFADGDKMKFTRILAIPTVSRQLHADYRDWPVSKNTFKVYSDDVAIFINRLPKHVRNLVMEIKVEHHLAWCLHYWEPEFKWFGEFNNLQRIVMLVPPGTDFSRVVTEVERGMLTDAKKSVTIQLEELVKDNPADKTIGRRRLL
jgi:hypothetical protein